MIWVHWWKLHSGALNPLIPGCLWCCRSAADEAEFMQRLKALKAEGKDKKAAVSASATHSASSATLSDA
jgi:hypothetical protein